MRRTSSNRETPRIESPHRAVRPGRPVHGMLRSAGAWALATAAVLALCCAASHGEASPTSPQAETPETGSNAVQTGGADQHLETEGSSRLERGPLIVLDGNAELRADETTDVVVVIGGSAKIHGKVRNAVVVVGGDLEVDGEVGDAVVVVLGNVKAKRGADLHQDVVAVMGSINVEPNAKIHGDARAIAGRLVVAKAASILGQRQEVAVNLQWLRQWLLQCLFKLRPLAPQVGWVWVVAGAFFLFYLLVATAFPRPVQACVDVLNDRPATTMVLGILAKLLAPIVALILAVTGIGLLVLPFLLLALFVGVVLGKVALLEWVGLSIGHRTGVRPWQKPLGAFVLGSLLLTLFYMVWVVGLLAYIWFSIWGLGVAVTALLESLHRKRTQAAATVPPETLVTPEVPPSAPAFMAAPEVPPAPAFTAASEVSPAPGFAPSLEVPPAPAVAAPGFGGTTETPETSVAHHASPFEPPPLTQPLKPAVVPDALSHPRAGFWEHMAAAFLDIVLLGVIGALGDLSMPWVLVVALAYFSAMWTWRGSTVGGTVLGLKVVRVDGHPLTFTVALVRALAAGFSIIVLFLGFLWIAWDLDKQGWHDRIAGTVVLRLPRGTPLVCY